ncbi:subtilase-type protease inhibitor [Nocardia sp.]|uniref:subtilase-type protease inhibitor n=1 Tax=Nocardia sp. TaxID=1821 RepID=UPI002626BC30|nr:subtilase-type protease inhibitor [Nocardia sp.]
MIGASVAALAVVSAAVVQAHADVGVGPSALTLTVGDGESLDAATNQRTVLLVCSPTVLGAHPQPGPACDELAAGGGDFGQLRDAPMRFCEFLYKPVTVAADGVWNGAAVSYRRTFPNSCMEKNASKYVFAF